MRIGGFEATTSQGIVWVLSFSVKLANISFILMCLHQLVSEIITDIFMFGLFTVVFFSLFSSFLLDFFFWAVKSSSCFHRVFVGRCLRTWHRCLSCFAQKQYLVISRAMYKYATQVPSVLLLNIHPSVPTLLLSTENLQELKHNSLCLPKWRPLLLSLFDSRGCQVSS